MNNPQVKGTKDYSESIEEFKGLDLNERITSGYLAWTKNCSSRKYPTISARYERGLVEDVDILCMCSLDGVIYYVNADGELYAKDGIVPIVTLTLDDQRQPFFVTMGSYIIVFPYGYYYNTTNDPGNPYLWDAGFIAGCLFNPIPEGSTEHPEVTVSYTMCNSQGDGIDAHAADSDPYYLDPSDPDYDADAHDDGYYWIDTGSDPHVLKRWSAIYEDWTQIPNTFTKIASTDIGLNVSEMDAVEIYGSGVIANETYTIYHKGNDYIVVPFLLEHIALNQTERLTFSRNIPRMDYIVECDNRLWGCAYGDPDMDGKYVNEIYASALGDFKNWNRFLGLSTDSYVASRGSDGPWTGAVSYLGTPIFFKEDHIEVVRPSATGAHQIETYHVNGTGVMNGSNKSVVVVDNVVYYHGLNGFYAYTGSLPRKISYQLGDNYYYDAVGGELNGIYYVCATDQATKERHLFTYDTNKNVWYREDEIDINNFARNGKELYFATYCGYDRYDPLSSAWINGSLYTVRGTEGDKSPVEWLAVTHDFAYGYQDTNAKRIYVRANITAGRKMKVYISYDSSYEWNLVGTIEGDGTHRYHDLPIVPARCDHYRLKFECNGDGCIWSIKTVFDNND